MLGSATGAIADEFYAAFWNVENLFDTRDDPDVQGDEEYTPTGDKHWTSQRLNVKLNNLARVIKEMNGRRGPDVLGLCEVENRDVLKSLIEKLKTLRRDYEIVHKNSPSGRGIDCAVIYDAKRLRLESSKFHFVDVDHTRDIVEAEFEARGKQLYVFVNHWPSRFNPESARIEAAKTLRRRLDEILRNDANADVLVMGDLNDTPRNLSVGKHLKTWGDATSLHPGVFFNPMFRLHEQGRGSYVYRNRWEMIDQVILSPGLLDKKGFRWQPDSIKLVLARYQLYHSKDPSLIPRPSRSFTRNSFHEDGYSDHLPVSCVLEF